MRGIENSGKSEKKGEFQKCMGKIGKLKESLGFCYRYCRKICRRYGETVMSILLISFLAIGPSLFIWASENPKFLGWFAYLDFIRDNKTRTQLNYTVENVSASIKNLTTPFGIDLGSFEWFFCFENLPGFGFLRNIKVYLGLFLSNIKMPHLPAWLPFSLFYDLMLGFIVPFLLIAIYFFIRYPLERKRQEGKRKKGKEIYTPLIRLLRLSFDFFMVLFILPFFLLGPPMLSFLVNSHLIEGKDLCKNVLNSLFLWVFLSLFVITIIIYLWIKKSIPRVSLGILVYIFYYLLYWIGVFSALRGLSLSPIPRTSGTYIGLAIPSIIFLVIPRLFLWLPVVSYLKIVLKEKSPISTRGERKIPDMPREERREASMPWWRKIPDMLRKIKKIFIEIVKIFINMFHYWRLTYLQVIQHGGRGRELIVISFFLGGVIVLSAALFPVISMYITSPSAVLPGILDYSTVLQDVEVLVSGTALLLAPLLIMVVAPEKMIPSSVGPYLRTVFYNEASIVVVGSGPLTRKFLEGMRTETHKVLNERLGVIDVCYSLWVLDYRGEADIVYEDPVLRRIGLIPSSIGEDRIYFPALMGGGGNPRDIMEKFMERLAVAKRVRGIIVTSRNHEVQDTVMRHLCSKRWNLALFMTGTETSTQFRQFHKILLKWGESDETQL